MPHVSGDCTFCEGSGKCKECQGSGVNPHINSPEAKCSHCSATGACPECDGTGRAGSRHKGNVLFYGLAWASGLIVFFGVFAAVSHTSLKVVLVVAWTVFWYAVFYRDSQRRKPAPPSRL
jgi:Flp pilus assembly protein TadB